MQFDFNEKPIEQSENLNEGRYTFQVVIAEEHESKAGNLSIKVKLKVKNKYTNIFLSPKTSWIAKAFLLSIGRKDLIELNNIDPSSIINYEGEAEFIYEEGPYLKVAEFYPKETITQEINTDEIPF